jgi:hypothetical protein
MLLVSCGPMNKRYNTKTYKNDIKEIKETGVSDGDTLLLSYYIQRANAKKEKIDSNSTYKELLEKARTEKMRREIKAFAYEDSAKATHQQEKARADELKKILSVAFVSVAVLTSDAESEFTILLNIQNNGTKNIKAFKGTMTFYDLFGAAVKRYELKYDMQVNAKEIKSYYFKTKYNDKSESDIALSEMDEAGIRFVFQPQQILFLDGTEMSL